MRIRKIRSDLPERRTPTVSMQRVPTTDAFLLGVAGWARSSLSRTTFTSSSRRPSTTTPATATRLTAYFRGDSTEQRIKPGSTASSFSICRRNSAGKSASCRCASSAILRSISRRAIALQAAGHPGSGDQRYAYQIGLGIGQLKAKTRLGDPSLWQHTEQYALDPNLVDSDIFDSRVNMEGRSASKRAMRLTDAIIFNLTYAYG